MFFFFDFENYSVNELIERIKTLTPLKDLESVGISQQAISNWKSRNSIPKADDLYKIAQKLDVSMEWLLTGHDRINDLTEQEQVILGNFRKLDEHDKNSISLMIEALAGK